MCMIIDHSVTSLNKRTVWKVFQKETDGRIVSLYMGHPYPLNKKIVRSRGRTSDGSMGTHGIHVYLNKKDALAEAINWQRSYIAKLRVQPSDFLFAGKDSDAGKAMYESATRIGTFI